LRNRRPRPDGTAGAAEPRRLLPPRSLGCALIVHHRDVRLRRHRDHRSHRRRGAEPEAGAAGRHQRGAGAHPPLLCAHPRRDHVHPALESGHLRDQPLRRDLRLHRLHRSGRHPPGRPHHRGAVGHQCRYLRGGADAPRTGRKGQAPRSFARTSRSGVPVMTVVTMIIALLAGVVLNYLYPDQALFLLGALATFATVLVWLIILVSHIRMKRVIAEEARLPSEFPMPMWPVGSWITVAVILFVIVMLGLVPHSRPALWVGLLWVAALMLCCVASVRGGGGRPHPLSDRTVPMGSGRIGCPGPRAARSSRRPPPQRRRTDDDRPDEPADDEQHAQPD